MIDLLVRGKKANFLILPTSLSWSFHQTNKQSGEIFGKQACCLFLSQIQCILYC